MPLFADHIANMYYGGSSSYSSAPYSSYTTPTSVYSSLGTSYSAPYLNPGGNYSSHSSIGGYSRAPISSRWLTGSTRGYSPMLSTISERSTSSPVRISSPRRIPFSKRSYTPTYTPRPININTADIDVSKERFQPKAASQTKAASPPKSMPPPPSSQENIVESSDNGPFMPRIDGKPETGIDSSPGQQRSTIRRGRTVVRLHTLRRKERDSPRKPQDLEQSDGESNLDKVKKDDDFVDNQPDSIGWRERLQNDLVYKDKREKKTLGEKLVEKFIVRDQDKTDFTKTSPRERTEETDNLQVLSSNARTADRRCSMEILAEQAKLLDSLIRNENLSTATLDLSKVGVNEVNDVIPTTDSIKRKNSFKQSNNLKTSQSDYSLHESLKLHKDMKTPKQFHKRKSLRKSSSGGHILSKLDSIKEFPKGFRLCELPPVEEKTPDINNVENPRSKTKSKISSTVEVSEPKSPLRFKVDVSVDEQKLSPKKTIVFNATVDEYSSTTAPTTVKLPLKTKQKDTKQEFQNKTPPTPSPEPDDGNFWDKIGKRETVYLVKRKQILDDAKEQNRRALFWFPGEEENENIEENVISEEPEQTTFNQEVINNNKQEDLLNQPMQVDIVEPIIRQTSDSVLITDINEYKSVVPINNDEILASNTSVEVNKEFEPMTSAKEVLKDGISDISEDHLETDLVNQHEIAKNLVDDKQTEILMVDDTLKSQANVVLESKEALDSGQVYGNSFEQLTENEQTEKSTIEANIQSGRSEETKTPSKNDDLYVENKNELKENPLLVREDQCEKCGQSLNLETAKKPTTKTKKTEIKTNVKQNNVKKVNTVKSKKSHNTEQTIDAVEKRKTSVNDIFVEQISTKEIEQPCTNNDKVENVSTDLLDKGLLDVKTDSDELNTAGINCNTESESIPNEPIPGEDNKAENSLKIEKQPEEKEPKSELKLLPSPRKPVPNEPATRPLIATPRPLQKKAPQVIKDSSSSDSSSDESSSEDSEESDSEGSGEFYECENNADGRTSTGSNDSGFDSSAPTSPALFHQIKKGGDSPGTSNVNATASSNDSIILEQELEQSTAYSLFRKTGRFTPPARSIPRFRKYVIDDFQFIKVLGKGSFGKVLLAELRDTEYYYAVKCLKKDVVLEDDDVECTLIERKVLALGTNHPYLCHLFATFQTDSHLFFVMEYLNGGDLMFHIQQSGRFPEARARFYAAEIVSGLKFLHKRGIVYRDLKLDNILLDFEGHVRIADFGMCKLQIYLEKTADTFCGTPDYMAPEIIKGLKYNQTVDWWSFGVLLYEMLIGQSPFSGCDEDELFWSICNEIPSYPRFLSQEALSILTRLLDKDAKTRLGGTECMHGDVRDQDFFRPIHWDRLERKELETPFRPRVRHPLDTQYFDRAFTGERPRLTAVEPHVLKSMDQEPFRGFSYTNPNATDR